MIQPIDPQFITAIITMLIPTSKPSMALRAAIYVAFTAVDHGTHLYRLGLADTGKVAQFVLVQARRWRRPLCASWAPPSCLFRDPPAGTLPLGIQSGYHLFLFS